MAIDWTMIKPDMGPGNGLELILTAVALVLTVMAVQKFLQKKKRSKELFAIAGWLLAFDTIMLLKHAGFAALGPLKEWVLHITIVVVGWYLLQLSK